MKTPRSSRSGLTLVELLVVLGVLVAVAGIVVPMVSHIISGPSFKTASGEKSAQQIATEATLTRTKEAIMGAGSCPGYYGDLGEVPSSIGDLFVKPSGTVNFDPSIRRGWRGPYIVTSTGKSAIDDLPTLIDAWGREILIQFPTEAGFDSEEYARLISAGPDGVVQTPSSQAMPSLASRGDDILLFLRVADERL